MPHRNSSEYGAVEPIPYPEVPPSVLNAGSVNDQILEMQEWFRAFKTQNKSHRNYTEYFKPILCYLEGIMYIVLNQCINGCHSILYLNKQEHGYLKRMT